MVKIALALLLACLAGPGACAAYLPDRGPSALRFQAAPLLCAFTLPPLRMTDVVTGDSQPASPPAAESISPSDWHAPLTPGAELSIVSEEAWKSDGTNGLRSSPAPAESISIENANAAAIASQRIVELFKRVSTNTSVNVAVPAGFIPPSQPSLPPSSATYNIK